MKQVIVVAGLIAVIGCTSDKLSNDASGTARTTGAAGTTGTAATTGTAGTNSGGPTGGGGHGGANVDAGRPAYIPCCIATLMAECPTDGACTQAGADGGAVSRACYASGVKLVSSSEEPSGCATPNDACGRSVTEVYKPDGSLCYRLEHASYCGQGCETLFDNWYNAAGELVAQSQLSGNHFTPPFCVPRMNVDSVCEKPPAGPACTVGTCP